MGGIIWAPDENVPFGNNELAAIASQNRLPEAPIHEVDEGPFDLAAIGEAGEGESAATTEDTGEVRTDVLVVGGGAAGIMAALEARKAGTRAILVEKEDRLGKKILISGGGKCNLTNQEISLENYHGSHPRFVQDVIRDFTNRDLVEWIETLGVETWIDEATGKVWPVEMRSRVVTDALERALADAGVEVRTRSALAQLEATTDGPFRASLADGRTIVAGAVVLATGGLAAPQLGADGSGLKVAEQFGHRLVTQAPALVGLVVAEEWVRRLSGVTCEEIELTLEVDGKELLTVEGDLLFTHYGINSPAVFRLSREASPALAEGRAVRVLVNFRPDLFTDQVKARSMVDHALGGNTKKHSGTVVANITGIRRLADTLVTLVGADPSMRVREIQHKERDALTELLWRCPLTVTATRGWQFAEVMRGGVDVRKVDPRTMESKLVPGLFLCGEMLDIDADVGGFNFQFAFASGKAAGVAAAQRVRR